MTATYILVSHFLWLVLSTHCIEAVAEAPYIGLTGDPPCPECGGPDRETVSWVEEYPGVSKLVGFFKERCIGLNNFQ